MEPSERRIRKTLRRLPAGVRRGGAPRPPGLASGGPGRRYPPAPRTARQAPAEDLAEVLIDLRAA